jgi:dynein heavy chain, axonemal
MQMGPPRFNTLLRVVSRSVAELQRGLKGQVVMSAELEDMYGALLNSQVPALWARAAYPSLKPLASWVRDFTARMQALQEWLTDGEPLCFWLPGEAPPYLSHQTRCAGSSTSKGT